MVRLNYAGETEAALLLLRPIVLAEKQHGWWRTAGVLAEIVPAVFPKLGVGGLEVIADALDQALDERWPISRAGRDYSYTWRPTLEGGRERDREGALVSALRDAAALVARTTHFGVRAVVEALERRQRPIFHRIALHVLRLVPEELLIAERLSRRELLDDAQLEREYTLLLREHGTDLPDDVRARILGWINAGPEDDGVDSEAVDRWRLHQLARFGDTLPADQIRRYHALVDRFGEPADPWAELRIGSGHSAPLTTDKLLSLSDGDLVELLRTWQPDSGFLTPSREGLSENLQEAAAQFPGRFADLATAFAGLHPAYSHGLIKGLGRATKGNTTFPWRPVLDLCLGLLDKTRSLHASNEQHEDEKRSSRAGLRMDIARLLADGLSHSTVPADSSHEVFEILAELASDPDPSMGYEQRRLAAGGTWPATLDLNTVRGTAFHALAQYAWWLKKQTPAGETPRLTPQLRNLLDRHLDTHQEPTETIRSVYGQYFPALMACDEDWARSRVDAIFPQDPSLEHLRQAAWESYLLFNRAYANVHELLGEHYRQAVIRFGDDHSGEPSERADETRDALIGHVLGLYVLGRIDLVAGSLVDIFFSHAPTKMRARLIELAGFNLVNEDQPSQRALARLQRLWERRMNILLQDHESPDLHELQRFGLWFASGKFDDRWALSQLYALLTAGGPIDPDHRVIEHLAALRHDHLSQVVACLALVIDASQRHLPPKPWFVTASHDEIRAILDDGINAADQATRSLAQRSVNRLIARRHTRFEELLS